MASVSKVEENILLAHHKQDKDAAAKKVQTVPDCGWKKKHYKQILALLLRFVFFFLCDH